MLLHIAAAASLLSISALAAEQPASEAFSCPLTPVIHALPDELAASGTGPSWWYMNADRSMWAIGTHMVKGGNKVPWIRPKGTELRIATRRLDADSPPAQVAIPCCYGGEFQVSGIDFPEAGCWEVTATAGASSLTFVTLVQPGAMNERDAT
jgi:hypothetical protein